MTHSVLFVCTGNICRSPTADGIIRALAPHLAVDSCGVHGYHVGEAPDARSQRMAKSRGYDLATLRARQISSDDFYTFDLILAMDQGHERELRQLMPKDATAHIALFCEHAGLGRKCVPDPYYGSTKDFEECFTLIEDGCRKIVAIL